jgi:hypothetical protein
MSKKTKKSMPKEDARTDEKAENGRTLEAIWEWVLLIWVLGIFYYFYETRGYLEMVGQLIGG